MLPRVPNADSGRRTGRPRSGTCDGTKGADEKGEGLADFTAARAHGAFDHVAAAVITKGHDGAVEVERHDIAAIYKGEEAKLAGSGFAGRAFDLRQRDAIAPLLRTRYSSEASSMSLNRPISEGVLSLEVRWIIRGALPPEMIEWFGPFPGGIDSRRDSYLMSRMSSETAVKIRGDSQLDVKVCGRSPDPLTVPGRAQGRLEWWRKWSFPLRPVAPDTEYAGWASVQKVRRIQFFSLEGRPIPSPATAAGEEACAVELTNVSIGRDRWWTLGFEATGPSGALVGGLKKSAALVFDHPLPGDLRLDMADSTSYSGWLEWLRTDTGR
jgi:hypothetical protein